MSDKETLGYSEYTPVKQKHFEGIVDMHIRITKSIIERHTWAHPVYHYFDINAGPGIYERIKGSPLIFLELAKKHCLDYRAVLIESNEQYYQDLLRRTKKYQDCEVLSGDHNDVMQQRFFSKKHPSIFGILYNDPTGQQPSFDLLSDASKCYPKLDLLIYCPATNIKRVAHSKKTAETLLDGLAKIDKKVWIVRKPMGNQQWSFLIGSNWIDFPAWEKEGFHNIQSERGQEILAELNYTKKELIGKKSINKAYNETQEKRKCKEVVGNSPFIMLTDWNNFGHPDLLIPPLESKATFNKTNENIEWAKWSWNPVTGCKHGCRYCYARDIARRFYGEYDFEPTFHPARLLAPENTKPPKTDDIGYHNVFVCSMADLFGHWVPAEWIVRVLKACRDAPQWNFLFLTKNPEQLVDIDFPDNAWVGTTVDTQVRVSPAEKAFKRVKAKVKFLSCEPLLENLAFSTLEVFDWVIIGGQSETTNQPAKQPEWEWVEHLLTQARKAECKVYFKPNLTIAPKEYPEEMVTERQIQLF